MSSSRSDNQEPSTSAHAFEMDGVVEEVAAKSTKHTDDYELSDKDLDKVMTVEEYLQKSKTFMLDYEKHMFLDTIDTDCLVVCAKCVLIATHTHTHCSLF